MDPRTQQAFVTALTKPGTLGPGANPLMGGYKPPTATMPQGTQPAAQPGAVDPLADIRAQIASTQALIASLSKQREVMPPSYDFVGAYSRAGQQAAAAQNPLYEKKLGLFLKGQELKRAQKQNDAASLTQAAQDALADTREDAATGKIRTEEDVTSKLADIANEQTVFQDADAQQFETELEQAQKGGGTGGLSEQRVDRTIKNRNTVAGQKERSFNVQKEQTNLFKSRTFEDLERGVGRTERDTNRKIEKVTYDLNQGLADLDIDTELGRIGNEAERLSAVNEDTRVREANMLRDWINGLRGEQRTAALKYYGNRL